MQHPFFIMAVVIWAFSCSRFPHRNTLIFRGLVISPNEVPLDICKPVQGKQRAGSFLVFPFGQQGPGNWEPQQQPASISQCHSVSFTEQDQENSPALLVSWSLYTWNQTPGTIFLFFYLSPNPHPCSCLGFQVSGLWAFQTNLYKFFNLIWHWSPFLTHLVDLPFQKECQEHDQWLHWTWLMQNQAFFPCSTLSLHIKSKFILHINTESY